MLIPSELLGLAGCAATVEHARFGATQGVLLERDSGGTARAVATDGRIMAVAEWNEPEVPQEERIPGWKAVVPAKLWRLCCRRAARTVNQHWQAVEAPLPAAPKKPADRAERVAMAVSDLRLDAIQEQGMFPDWRKVWGPWTKAIECLDLAAHAGKYVPVAFSTDVLLHVCELARDMGLDRVIVDVPVTAPLAGSDGRPPLVPLRFLAAENGGGNVTVRGLVLPCTLPAIAEYAVAQTATTSLNPQLSTGTTS